MKNKFIKIIPLLGISTLSITSFVSLTTNNIQFKSNIDSDFSHFNNVIPNNFNLETQKLTSPFFS